MQPLKGYLGAPLRDGEHTYTFVFQPLLHFLGLAVSVLTLAVICFVIVFKKPRWLCRLLAPQ